MFSIEWCVCSNYHIPSIFAINILINDHKLTEEKGNSKYIMKDLSKFRR